LWQAGDETYALLASFAASLLDEVNIPGLASVEVVEGGDGPAPSTA